MATKNRNGSAAKSRQWLAQDPTIFIDAGYAAALAQFFPSPARFEVGEPAMYFDNQDEYGSEVRVAGSYGLHAVAADNGAYLGSDGQRFDYLFGYDLDCQGEQFFGSPHQLTRLDGKPSHLRLVATRPTAEGTTPKLSAQ